MANASGNIALGIDLGTTNSCVAVYRNGRVETIQNIKSGRYITPSWVTYTDDQVLIGHAAKNNAYLNIKGSVYGIKRIIGRKYDDPVVQKVARNWKFGIKDDKGAVKIEILHKNEKKLMYPEQISGLILRELKEIAETFLGEKSLTDVVITVPAYFNDHQRQATIDAAKIANLKVLRLINEPTAAAIAYICDRPGKNERNILVYDLGGGTFDVSIVSLEGSNVKVRATCGDTSLGGANFDENCVSYFTKLIQDKYQINMIEAMNLKLLVRLQNTMEKAKHTLSTLTTTTIDVPAIWQNIDLQENFSRARFNDINGDLLQRTFEIVEQCLKEAKLTKEEIDEILLVGGSSRIPLIEEELKNMFNKPIRKAISQEEAVAHGAAILAAKLNGTLPHELNINDVTSMSLGIETMNDEMSFLIKRNTQIPTQAQLVYTTAHPEDNAIRITVLEGDNQSARKNLELGFFDLLNLPKNPSVNVTFMIDPNGILTVNAVETSSGINKTINAILNKGRLNLTELKKLQRKSNAIKDSNQEFHAINERRNEFEKYLFGLKRDVEKGKYEVNAREKGIMLNRIEEALKWVATKDANDVKKIDQKHTTISKYCSHFLKE